MTADAGWSDREVRADATPWRQVAAGVLLVVLEHALVGGLLGGGGYLLGVVAGQSMEAYTLPFFFWGFGIGLTQLGYIVPTVLIALVVRRYVAAGVMLGALATFLLNGACFGVMCGAIGV